MSRELTENEKKVYNLFNKGPALKEMTDVSFISIGVKKQKWFVPDPLVYEVKGTDSVLILGEPKHSLNIDFLKKLYEGHKKQGTITSDNVNDVDKEEIFTIIKSQVGASDEEIRRSLEVNRYDVIKTLLDLSK